MRVAPILIAAALAATGCGDRGAAEPPAPTGADPARVGAGVDNAERDVVLDWIAAINDADYERAAGLFAPGAIVEQAVVIELRTREQAIAFNRSLPCRAELTDLEPVPKQPEAVLSAFRLSDGPDQRCGQGIGGGARVLFVIEDGEILEWRQLPDPVEDPDAAV